MAKDKKRDKKNEGKKSRGAGKQKHPGKDSKPGKKKRRADPDASQRVTPYLLYGDVAAALDWLTRAFGFVEFGDRFLGPDGVVQHAAMRTSERGEVLMMGCPGPGYQNPRALGSTTQMLYIEVEDVDSHFARAEQAGAEVVETPGDTFYGHRRYTVEDPEGHQWAFAQHIRDVSAEEMRQAMASESEDVG